MKHSYNAVRLIRELCGRSDRYIVGFFLSHSNLITALVALGLAVWGLSLGHIWYFFGLIAVGAISYFLGITFGLSGGILLGIVRILHPELGSPRITIAIVEMIGYFSIAWLGYRHKEQKQRQNSHVLDANHSDQVLSWAVANEIRTSLAAVRFLLFPLHDEKTNSQLETVTKELSRLENLFSEIENRQERKNS